MKYRKIINKLILMVGVTTTAVLTSCEQEFYQDEQIGILNRQNHSMRNVVLYPDDLEHIKTINLILKHN